MNSELTIDKYVTIRNIFEGLRLAAGIPDSDNTLFIPEGTGSKKSIVKRLCSSLQNSGQMRNSIKYNQDKKSKQIIRSVVCNYDSTEFVRTYTKWEDVYKALISTGVNDNGVKKGYKSGIPRSNWEKYSKGLYDGLRFLEENNKYGYKIVQELINCSDSSDEVSEGMLKCITEISKNIYNLGFALTCDWLKESGCTWLVKPDIHIVEVYKHLVGTEKVSNAELIIDMFDYARLIQKELNDKSMTAYKLDKMIWLICTGNFYQYNRQIGRDLIIKLVK